MTNIVYTNTVKMRHGIADMHSAHMPTDRKVTIFQQPGKVAMVDGTLVVGRPSHKEEHRDKRYYKWRSIATCGLRRNSNGTIIAWQATRPYTFKVGDQWQHVGATRRVWETLNTESDRPEAEPFRRAVWETFGIKSMYDVFPIAGHYGLHRYETIPYALRSPMRQPTVAEFATQTFGKSRVDSRMIAAVGNTEPFIVALAHQFRGLVDNSLLTRFMENNHFDDEMEESFQSFSPWVRPVLKNINQVSRDNIVRETLDMSTLIRIHNISAYSRNKYHIARHRTDETYSSWEDLQNPGRKRLVKLAASTQAGGSAFTKAAQAAQQAQLAVTKVFAPQQINHQPLTPLPF